MFLQQQLSIILHSLMYSNISSSPKVFHWQLHNNEWKTVDADGLWPKMDNMSMAMNERI
jgi:hypothetical protein